MHIELVPFEFIKTLHVGGGMLYLIFCMITYLSQKCFALS